MKGASVDLRWMVLLAALVGAPNPARSTEEDFFKGATVRLIIGTSSGGAQDLRGRIVARYLGRQIPGNPEGVVQNMPGAGTVIAANHIHGRDQHTRIYRKWQTLGTKFKVISGYEGTGTILVAMRRKEIDGGCWTWESVRTTARSMLDAKGEDKLIPYLIHRPRDGPEVKDLPLITG